MTSNRNTDVLFWLTWLCAGRGLGMQIGAGRGGVVRMISVQFRPVPVLLFIHCHILYLIVLGAYDLRFNWYQNTPNLVHPSLHCVSCHLYFSWSSVLGAMSDQVCLQTKTVAYVIQNKRTVLSNHFFATVISLIGYNISHWNTMKNACECNSFLLGSCLTPVIWKSITVLTWQTNLAHYFLTCSQ